MWEFSYFTRSSHYILSFFFFLISAHSRGLPSSRSVFFSVSHDLWLCCQTRERPQASAARWDLGSPAHTSLIPRQGSRGQGFWIITPTPPAPHIPAGPSRGLLGSPALTGVVPCVCASSLSSGCTGGPAWTQGMGSAHSMEHLREIGVGTPLSRLAKASTIKGQLALIQSNVCRVWKIFPFS